MEGGGGGTVGALIHKAVDSTAGEVDPRLLKSIKSVVRYSDSEVHVAAQVLLLLMRRNHSQVRYLSLLIIDQLFMRSKLFRSIIVENMDQLLTLSVGFRTSMPLPPPSSIASCLRSSAIEFLDRWNSSYGVNYRQLRLGFDYLKNTLRLQFPDLQSSNAAARIEQERRREREMRSKEISLKKFDALRANFSSMKEEVESTIDEIEHCLDIVRTEDEEFVPLLGPFEDGDFFEFRSAELMEIRLASLKEGEKLQENRDNKVVFDALRELYKLLVMKHLVSVQESITIVVRVDVADKRVRDSTLKELINIQNGILSVKKKCNELVSILSNNNNGVEEEEEDFWEEGKIEVDDEEEGNPGAPENLCIPSENPSIPSTSASGVNDDDKLNHQKEVAAGGDNKKRRRSLKDKLLAEAPVMTWGSCLENWGGLARGQVLVNQRGLDLESHWGRVDYDAIIPADKIAEMNVQATLYKEEKLAVAAIQPCLAPLSKGGKGKGEGGERGLLCQRRDLKVCLFHGPIVPRDSEGKPINNIEEMACSVDDDQNGNCDAIEENDDIEVKKRLAAAEQAVKNVRRRDREEAEERRSLKQDKKTLKRAKLAKVRAHNEAVLRDAALASTSKSAVIGGGEEEMEETVGSGKLSATRRNKKEKTTLASMLKKRVAAKDRIGQRLLHSHGHGHAAAADVTTVRRMESDGDRCYREKFPNQW